MKELLNYTLFSIDNYQLTLGAIISMLFFLVFIVIILKLVRKSIFSYSNLDEGKKYSLYALLKYFAYIIAFIGCLQIIGINLSLLLAGSAALLVGLGLGIQNLFSDYISGIVILFDSSIKVGDIIEINGLVSKVQEINLRNTLVLTRDDKYMLLPNTDLTRNPIINWTYQEINSRFEVSVGVAYSSDVNLVMELMENAAKENEQVAQQPAPFVRLNNYGDSAVEFILFFWTHDVFRVDNIKSNIRIRLFELFKTHNIEIPFPQRVIHTK